MAHLMTVQSLLLLVWMAECAQFRATRARTELLNVCMDAKHHKEKPAWRTIYMSSAAPGRRIPAVPGTQARKHIRTFPTCTDSGTTAGLWHRNANGTLSKTPASMSVPQTWDPGSSRWTRAGTKSGSLMFPCAKRTVCSGGRTAAARLPARATGTRGGTGLQGIMSAPCEPPAIPSPSTPLHLLLCVRKSGVTPASSATTAEGAAAASRCGSTQPTATPTRKWRGSMLRP